MAGTLDRFWSFLPLSRWLPRYQCAWLGSDVVAGVTLAAYAVPVSLAYAALPTVELSSIKLDLYRRDFTINAMAIHLNPERFGTLVDYFNCQNDLKERRIQVLHNLSFVEDPTRVFRAARYAGRLGLRPDAGTLAAIRLAVEQPGYVALSGQRLWS